MKSTTIYKSLLALAAPMLLAACSSSADEPVNPDDNFEGIILNIPSLSTRAGEEDNYSNPSADEKEIKKLTVLAYNVKSPTSTTDGPEVIEVDPTGVNDGNYTAKRVPLKAGQYHIYVLANIASDKGLVKSDGYEITSFATMSEATLKAAYLNTKATTTLPETGMPMTCSNSAIKEGGSTADKMIGESGSIEIVKGTPKVIYADLTFCYSKVRYAVFNPAVGDLRFGTQPVAVTNSAKKTGVFTGFESLTSTDLEDVQITGSYCDLPTGVDGSKDDDYYSTVSLDGLKVKDDQTTPGSEWAYQGTVYVPEHLFTTNPKPDTATELAFKFNLNTYDKSFMFGQKTTLPESNYGASVEKDGVVRGVVYEVVAFTKKKEISLQVRVKKWGYYKYQYELDMEGNVNEIENE